MENAIRAKLVSLLNEIAEEPDFDENKYFEFSKLLGGGKVEDLYGRAWNELTELYVTWKHAGEKLRKDPDFNRSLTEETRRKLHALALEIGKARNNT
jgi:hypothetical protein